jgi:hypothetical protein
MARRKASGRSTFSNLRVKDVLPIWTSANSNLNTAMFVSYLQGLGITGIPSYLRKLAIPVVLFVLVGACAGAIHSGVSGMFVGALLGLATPAALIWLVITLIHMAIYLIAFCAAWVVIFYVVRWLFSSGF